MAFIKHVSMKCNICNLELFIRQNIEVSLTRVEYYYTIYCLMCIYYSSKLK